jgi:hypothetical protein
VISERGASCGRGWLRKPRDRIKQYSNSTPDDAVKHYAAAIGVLRSFGAPYTSKTKRVVSKPVTMACRNSAAQRRAARPAPCGRLELAGTRRQAGVDGADRETEALLRMSAIQLRCLADNAPTSGWICDGTRTPGRPQPQNEPMLILPV